MNGGVARWSDRYGGGGGSVSEEQVRSVELENSAGDGRENGACTHSAAGLQEEKRQVDIQACSSHSHTSAAMRSCYHSAKHG